MKTFQSLDAFCPPNTPVALTIGNFDGVHLGHAAVLNRLKSVANYRVVFTFSNHPYEVLKKTAISRLSTLSHRLVLFKEHGVNSTILIPFTESFSKQPAREFLLSLKQKIPFSYLILGHDAVIGHDRKKDLHEYCDELDFTLEYLNPIYTEDKIVSSSAIRKSIYAGELTEASTFLGRPYSIFATVEPGEKKGRALGFHTANLPVEELALPPFGVYAVQVKINNQAFPAVANLGYAPTLHKDRPPCLEVHLIDDQRNLYGNSLEVFFIQFLRPEKRFASISDLKDQIKQDISLATRILL